MIFNHRISKKKIIFCLVPLFILILFIEGCGGWTYAYDRDPRARIIYIVEDNAKSEFWTKFSDISNKENFRVTLQSSSSSHGEYKTLWGRKLEAWVTGSIFPDSNQVIVTMYASKIKFLRPQELTFLESATIFSDSLKEIKNVEQVSFEILKPDR